MSSVSLEELAKKQIPTKARWAHQVTHVLVKRKGRTTIAVVLQGATMGWVAIAIETEGKDLGHVLEDHAHHLVGEFKTKAAAVKASEKYVREWKTKKDKCACVDLDAKRRAKGTA